MQVEREPAMYSEIKAKRVRYYEAGPHFDVYDILQYLQERTTLKAFEFHLLGQVLKYVVRAFYGERLDESLEKARNIIVRLQEVRHAS